MNDLQLITNSEDELKYYPSDNNTRVDYLVSPKG